jgi:hypothetical protein
MLDPVATTTPAGMPRWGPEEAKAIAPTPMAIKAKATARRNRLLVLLSKVGKAMRERVGSLVISGGLQKHSSLFELLAIDFAAIVFWQ